MRTKIIAEAGVNHNGNIKIGRQLIEKAAEAKADFVKFQSFKASNLATLEAPKAKYQVEGTDSGESQFEMLKRLELDENMLIQFIEHAKKCKIGFLSTAFDIESAQLLLEQGQRIFKIPSGEITNLPLLRFLGSVAEEIILSTGMSDMNEIGRALHEIEKKGFSRNRITVLHCTSAYPTPMRDVNLRAMCNISDTFKVEVGYSDHTLGIEVPIAAVALGASIIEKHFTLDRNMKGPDHKASLLPEELTSMISQIRNIELALGHYSKEITKSEIINRDVVRKSIVASEDIKKGDIFSEKNLTTKRPGTGVSPMNWDLLLGKIASKSYLRDQMIDEA